MFSQKLRRIGIIAIALALGIWTITVAVGGCSAKPNSPSDSPPVGAR